ncbi:hypothetical protein C8J55DRAFT_483920 [Lentinula edodes]|uniref:Uncharacterized protein n=1 Tax=Lentinula lateritia TaxID=40482 RepID=A0A9W9E1J4_9AGAR|nr:hypothetical protein C8J55DRAFT_483920 [Lentinula edodes]
MLTRSPVLVNSCTEDVRAEERRAVARLADRPMDGRAVVLANVTTWETGDADGEVMLLLVMLVGETGIDVVILEGEETEEVYEPVGSVELNTPDEVYVVDVVKVILEVEVKEGVRVERLPGSEEALDIGMIGSGRVFDVAGPEDLKWPEFVVVDTSEIEMVDVIESVLAEVIKGLSVIFGNEVDKADEVSVARELVDPEASVPVSVFKDVSTGDELLSVELLDWEGFAEVVVADRRSELVEEFPGKDLEELLALLD